MALYTVQAGSYPEAVQLLAEQRMSVDATTLRRVALSTARDDVALRDVALDRARRTPVAPGGPLAGLRVRLSIDGGRVRTRSPRPGRRTKKGRHRFATPWREPRVLLIDVLDRKGWPPLHRWRQWPIQPRLLAIRIGHDEGDGIPVYVQGNDLRRLAHGLLLLAEDRSLGIFDPSKDNPRKPLRGGCQLQRNDVPVLREGSIVVCSPVAFDGDVPNIFFYQFRPVKGVEAVLREHEDEFVLAIWSVASGWFYEGIAPVPDYWTSKGPASALHRECYFPWDSDYPTCQYRVRHFAIRV